MLIHKSHCINRTNKIVNNVPLIDLHVRATPEFHCDAGKGTLCNTHTWLNVIFTVPFLDVLIIYSLLIQDGFPALRDVFLTILYFVPIFSLPAYSVTVILFDFKVASQVV